MKGDEILEAISETAVRVGAVGVRMQFDTLKFMRNEDKQGLFLVRQHRGNYNFCGIPVVEDVRVPFNTVIFDGPDGKQLARIEVSKGPDT
jgi:hypothetical protein